jgi:hypothetical protein
MQTKPQISRAYSVELLVSENSGGYSFSVADALRLLGAIVSVPAQQRI